MNNWIITLPDDSEEIIKAERIQVNGETLFLGGVMESNGMMVMDATQVWAGGTWKRVGLSTVVSV